MKIKMFFGMTIDDDDWFWVQVLYEDLEKVNRGPIGLAQLADDTDALIVAWCQEQFPPDDFHFERERFYLKGHEKVVELRLRWDGAEVAIT